MYKTDFVICNERLYLPTDPVGFLSYWAELLGRLPENATNPEIILECDDDYGEDFVTVTFRYTREETAEEVTHRTGHAARVVEAQVAADLKELERLEAKYGKIY